MESYWIRKENLTIEALYKLQELGYVIDQTYFSEKNSDILFTTNLPYKKTYTFANYELAYADGDPHRTWLNNEVRKEIKTSKEFINKLTNKIL